MKVKQYLQQLRKLDIVINQKIEERETLRASLTSIASPDLSNERVQGGDPPGDARFVKAIARVIDLEKEIDETIDSFVDKKHLIIDQIQGLSNAAYIDLLYKRYVEYKRLEVISVEMNYTYQYTKEMHGYALQDFERTYPNLP